MNTEIKAAIRAADLKARYDTQAKRLLSNKWILAHILIKTIDDFSGMTLEDVIPYIEGEPLVGAIPVDPGLTNTASINNGQRIIGMNTENAKIGEGLARFDIVFYVRLKDGISQVIVNLEAQKDEPKNYPVLNRAIFYGSRLISSQKERDFTGMNYGNIRRVFSIWICMNTSENSMAHIHLAKEDLVGTYPWKGRLDLLNVVMIGLGRNFPKPDKKQELHRLLGVLLSMGLSVKEKCEIIETEYRIPGNDGIREDLNIMCNLSQGILERGIEQGLEKGILEGEQRGLVKGELQTETRFILNMYEKGYTLEQIAEVAGKSAETIRSIIKKQQAGMV